MRAGELVALDRAIRSGGRHELLDRAAGRRGSRLGRRGGGARNPYTPAASAVQLPATAIWVSTGGLTLADGDTTVDQWLATYGGIRPTLAALAATNRPAYSASGGAGGRPLLTFDGTDNVLTGAITKGSAWDTYECGFVGSRVAFGATGDRIIGYFNVTTIRFAIVENNASALRFTVSGGANTAGTTDPDGVTAHWSADASPTGASSTQNMRKTGVVEGTSLSTTTSRSDGESVGLGAVPDGTLASNITAQAAYVGPALTADQRTYLRGLLSYLTGVSC